MAETLARILDMWSMTRMSEPWRNCHSRPSAASLSKFAEAVEKRLEAWLPGLSNLIILNVMMPVMDGPATLKQTREIPSVKSVPVIFMTAEAQPQEVLEYKAQGVLDVIPKPFDPITLTAVVRSIWARADV